MKHPAPYAFPLKSRAAMTDYILDRRGYYESGRKYPFSWNVKAHYVNYDRPKGECVLDPALDVAWAKHVEKCAWICEAAFEDARRELSEGEWTSYPGDDQGDWKFDFLGKSGGHLCLISWRGAGLSGRGGEDIRDWLAEAPFAKLRTFYRALVCMDSDFTPRKASENVEYQLNFLRGLWEEEKGADREAKIAEFVECLEASRPDLYSAEI